MRQQEASASRQRLRQQEQELDHMRQQLLGHSHHQVEYDHIEEGHYYCPYKVLSGEIDKLRNETER